MRNDKDGGRRRDVHHCHGRWSETGGEVGFEGEAEMANKELNRAQMP
jgi:hypothetical protein